MKTKRVANNRAMESKTRAPARTRGEPPEARRTATQSKRPKALLTQRGGKQRTNKPERQSKTTNPDQTSDEITKRRPGKRKTTNIHTLTHTHIYLIAII